MRREVLLLPGVLLALMVVGLALRFILPQAVPEPPPPPRTSIAEFQARAREGKPGPFTYDKKTDTYQVRTPRAPK